MEFLSNMWYSIAFYLRRFRDLVPFVQFKKNVKNAHGGVLLFAKLEAFQPFASIGVFHVF